jgi:hypothetical protein
MKLHQKVIDLIEKKYRVLTYLDLLYYDGRLDQLNQILSDYQDYVFLPEERIIILHDDTDYYANAESIGNTIYNLFKLMNKYNIPMEFVIVLTNHWGIETEIEKLSQTILNSQSPRVIYTALNFDFPENLDNLPKLEYQNIDHLYACLNGVERAHRVLTLCHLQHHDLITQGLISHHFKNE